MKFHKPSENILIDYIDDLLSVEERNAVEQQLAQSSEMRSELEELKTIMCAMDAPTNHQPSANLKNNFDQFLEEEMANLNQLNNASTAKVVPLKKRNRFLLQLAAAAAILLIGVFVGKEIAWEDNATIKQDIIAEVRAEMQELLKANSTSARIKGVNVSYKVEEADLQIVNSLVKRMNEDPSTNVRLAAIEALANFSNEQIVRNAFCETLEIQTDPMLQISVIEILTDLEEKRAIKYFKQLIEKDEITNDVKDEAQMGIFKMT